MNKESRKEIIIVRSIAESDLGLFEIHRPRIKAKQRAININAPIAQRMIIPHLFDRGGANLRCIISFNGVENDSQRPFSKSQKNWRLGGNKIAGEHYSKIDCKDFLLLRTLEYNDGQAPVYLTIVSKVLDRVTHAGVGAIIERFLSGSMALFEEDSEQFAALTSHCPNGNGYASKQPIDLINLSLQSNSKIPPMPRDLDNTNAQIPKSVLEKLQSPHFLEQMLKVAGDLSAPAQMKFMDTVALLADQLRQMLIANNQIIRLEKNHQLLWSRLAGQQIGFVDGGLANLSTLGSAPIAARVGGYLVTPGDRTQEREKFTVLKYLIDELYAAADGGVYDGLYPDIGALRDAARITIEAAGAVQMVTEYPDAKWVFMHGSLVNPISRYTDLIREGRVRYRFPDFSSKAINDLLANDKNKFEGRDANFINVYYRQLETLRNSGSIVCGVVERESQSILLTRFLIKALPNNIIQERMPIPAIQWKEWFLKSMDPNEDDEIDGQRITDALLFRCILEPGEAIVPIPLDRNELRRAPDAWKDVIGKYPKPWVSYLQPTEWSTPVRLEMFEEGAQTFRETAELLYHCCLLLPKYAFPVGLDIVDKFARIPNWMSKPINTYTVVQSMKRALDSGDSRLFDGLRRILCGSGREWLLRPGIYN